MKYILLAMMFLTLIGCGGQEREPQVWDCTPRGVYINETSLPTAYGPFQLSKINTVNGQRIRSVIKFEASDGREFDTRAEAEHYEKLLPILTNLYKYKKEHGWRYWYAADVSDDEIAEFILENYEARE